MIISKNKFNPLINQDVTYSHYDILPTILDLAGAQGEYEALGQSIYTKSKNTISPLIQPYDGGRVVFIDYPIKRTWVRATKKFYETILGADEIEKPILKKIDEYTQDAIGFMFAELELVKKEED